jgi:hypothetical protein
MPPAFLRPPVEVAEILRAHAEAYRRGHPLSPQQATVVRHLTQCRTAALGGHVDACAGCGYQRISYNSCRDRHCPKCQGQQRAAWLEARRERLLPVTYFHVVFTLPDVLNPLVLRNQAVLYDLLFQAASQSLLQLAADPKRLGAQPGLTAILHTWGQNLLFHPHLHCVVTGGGLTTDGQRWQASRPNYFLPVRVLGRLFRGKFLAGLEALFDASQLNLGSATEALAFRRWLTPLYRRNWVVYAKRPFGGAEQVFGYLGRYTHRVAISNSRLVSLVDGRVSFQWKDYADAHRTKVMSLTTEEFIRRFLLHVLPPRFVRIRHYGLHAGRNVSTKLARCRELLGATAVSTLARRTWQEWVQQWTGEDPRVCPVCQGMLRRWRLRVGPSVPEVRSGCLGGAASINSS